MIRGVWAGVLRKRVEDKKAAKKKKSSNIPA
jgi:hypothetical protein